VQPIRFRLLACSPRDCSLLYVECPSGNSCYFLLRMVPPLHPCPRVSFSRQRVFVSPRPTLTTDGGGVFLLLLQSSERAPPSFFCPEPNSLPDVCRSSKPRDFPSAPVENAAGRPPNGYFAGMAFPHFPSILLSFTRPVPPACSIHSFAG